MIKGLEFFPQSYTSALLVKFFFCFGQISPVRFQCIVKKKNVRPMIFKVCIYPLFDNLESR